MFSFINDSKYKPSSNSANSLIYGIITPSMLIWTGSNLEVLEAGFPNTINSGGNTFQDLCIIDIFIVNSWD